MEMTKEQWDAYVEKDRVESQARFDALTPEQQKEFMRNARRFREKIDSGYPEDTGVNEDEITI